MATEGLNHDSNDLQSQQPVDTPLPRPERRARRAKSDRGLPTDEILSQLATTYLERQRTHWPKLVSEGLLPPPSPAVIRQMVDDFKARHRGAKPDLEAVRQFRELCAKLAGNYNRYSCDNSSPTSILDQMANALNKAHSEDRFVPWAYLYADYSVTGLDASRQGYTSYKELLRDRGHFIETTYIDDFTRASRSELEWWKLAALSKHWRKRLIGASDGFDLSNEHSDMMLTMYGLLSRLFIKGLQEKVRRGMHGAARRGTCLGKLSLGHTRRVHRDANGNVVCGPDGVPLKAPCVDPATQPFRLMIFELFVLQGWSPYRIARHFNKLKVEGWSGWTETAIRKLLWSGTAIGVFVWNRGHREFDPEEEKWVTVKNPRSKWEVYYDRNLALVPMDMWRTARRKLAAKRRASPLTGRKPTRNENSATTLFSGTLVCQYCSDNGINDPELKMARSTAKYKQIGCLHGVARAHGCELSCSKSVRIIEECLLGFLKDVLLTEAFMEERIAKAKVYLEQEAQKPQVNTAPLKSKIRATEAKLKKLFERIEDATDEDLCKAYDKRIKGLQKDLNDQQAALRAAERQNVKKVKSLDAKRAKQFLADMRGLLNDEIPRAAEAIRALTGPIKIRQEPAPGRNRGARWIAAFSPDFTRTLQYLAKDNSALSGLVLPDGQEPQPIEVVIDATPKYEQFAPKFKQLRDNGASIEAIAHAHGMSWQYAKEVLLYADTGQRPKWRAGQPTGKGSKPTQFKDISGEVARLRDTEKMSFTKIATKLGVGVGTVRRAYDYAHRDDVLDAAQRGETPSRGTYSQLGRAKCQKIRKLLGKGMKPEEIAAKVGCGASSVVRIRQQMQAEADGDQAA